MSKEKQTAEEMANEFYPPQTTDLICSPQLVRKAFIEGYNKATLKLQEQAKEIERLKGEMFTENCLRQAIITTMVSDSIKNSSDVDNLIQHLKTN